MPEILEVLRCSGASRWVPCPASAQHENKYPDKPNEAAEEGTAIHEIGSKVLEDFVARNFKGHTFKETDFLGTVSSNGVLITQEMIDIASFYIRDVMSECGKAKGDIVLLVEHKVEAPMIHPLVKGTLDGAVVVIDWANRRVVLKDLKTGWGIVEVHDCWQLLCYAIGLLGYIKDQGWPIPEEIELQICQPRPSHRDGRIRSVVLSMAELEQYFGTIQASAHDATSDNPTFRTGAHCKNCKGAHSCPALAEATYNVSVTTQCLTTQNLTPKQISSHLKMLEESAALIKAFTSALEDQAMAFIQSGKPVVDYVVERKESRRQWSADYDTVKAMGEMEGVALEKPALITPLQAISAGMDEEIVKALSTVTPGAFVLAKFNAKKAAKLFK